MALFHSAWRHFFRNMSELERLFADVASRLHLARGRVGMYIRHQMDVHGYPLPPLVQDTIDQIASSCEAQGALLQEVRGDLLALRARADAAMRNRKSPVDVDVFLDCSFVEQELDLRMALESMYELLGNICRF